MTLRVQLLLLQVTIANGTEGGTLITGRIPVDGTVVAGTGSTGSIESTQEPPR